MKTKSPPPLICIVGPTATGKTGLAIKLNRHLKGILVSADSRQVYREMDIVTGKDHPQNVKIHGLDIVNPDEECSVSLWYQAVSPLLFSDRLPIVVGGTGLFVKAITDGIPTMLIPPNPQLRNQLEALSLPDLQARLKSLSPTRFARLNHSDFLNPRRLIRAIEIESASSGQNLPSSKIVIHNHPSLIIGLRPPDSDSYSELITKRVLLRLNNGALKETSKLITKYGKNLPALTAIGYRSLTLFLEGKISQKEMINKWVSDELSYAKRQLTWFRKVPDLNWFSMEDPLLLTKAMNLVEKFINSCYDNKKDL
ncbi:MAG: tRNA (adenosine(37)-N6)-dimethylallyltransferase MiaA [bacterium]